MSRQGRGSAAVAFPGQAGRRAWPSTVVRDVHSGFVLLWHRAASLSETSGNAGRDLNVARPAKMVAAAAWGAALCSDRDAVDRVGSSGAFLVRADLADALHHLDRMADPLEPSEEAADRVLRLARGLGDLRDGRALQPAEHGRPAEWSGPH